MEKYVTDTKRMIKNQKYLAFKKKVKFKINRAKRWVIYNKETIIYITAVVVSGVVAVTKVINKRTNLRKAEEVKTLYCYGRSLGQYWSLKRKLSNKEWLEIDKRKNGERLAEILSKLKGLTPVEYRNQSLCTDL